MRIVNLPVMVVASLLTASGVCAAQEVHQNVIPTAVPITPKATQFKRCENFGKLVRMAADARDRHVPQNRFTSRFGPRKLSQGMLGVIDDVYASKQSPAALQEQMQKQCEARIS
ncbi:MAG TPA: hypothetical protein VFR91_02460 [Dyella sp.]|nr:hypothetical protein [Dyella sp.]